MDNCQCGSRQCQMSNSAQFGAYRNIRLNSNTRNKYVSNLKLKN